MTGPGLGGRVGGSLRFCRAVAGRRSPASGLGDCPDPWGRNRRLCSPAVPIAVIDVPSLLEALAERAAARAERHLHLDAPGPLLPRLRPLPGAERPPRRRRGRPASRPARPRRPTEADASRSLHCRACLCPSQRHPPDGCRARRAASRTDTDRQLIDSHGSGRCPGPA